VHMRFSETKRLGIPSGTVQWQALLTTVHIVKNRDPSVARKISDLLGSWILSILSKIY
jgi:hypothetical protein